MKLGVTLFATDRSMHIVDLARAVEERGFSSLYLPEHTHIPSSRRTPAPTGDAELPEMYRRTADPFVALGAAAAVTSKIEIGTGICLVAQHDPIVLAKATATLDHYSNGRLVFGIGFGWNREEMGHHGVEFRRRRAMVREKMLAVQKLWKEEAASFEGEFVRFEPSWSYPKPVRKVPVLIGGAAGPKLFSHIAEYADGWIPIGGAGMAKALPDLRAAFERADRDPDTAAIVPFGTLPNREKLDYYRGLGVEEVILSLPSADADVTLRKLDQYRDLLE